MVKPTKIFLSYARTESEYAGHLADDLHKRGFSVWQDANITPGNNWAQEVGKALDQSQAMVVLMSPSAVDSDRVTRDVEFAIGNARFKDRLFTVVVKPMHEHKIPWILRHLHFMRASNPVKAGELLAQSLSSEGRLAG